MTPVVTDPVARLSGYIGLPVKRDDQSKPYIELPVGSDGKIHNMNTQKLAEGLTKAYGVPVSDPNINYQLGYAKGNRFYLTETAITNVDKLNPQQQNDLKNLVASSRIVAPAGGTTKLHQAFDNSALAGAVTITGKQGFWKDLDALQIDGSRFKSSAEFAAAQNRIREILGNAVHGDTQLKKGGTNVYTGDARDADTAIITIEPKNLTPEKIAKLKAAFANPPPQGKVTNTAKIDPRKKPVGSHAPA